MKYHPFACLLLGLLVLFILKYLASPVIKKKLKYFLESGNLEEKN
jgi:hypothetical protein